MTSLEVARPSHLPIACFVSTQSNSLGVGKLLAVSGDIGTVEYFTSVKDRFSHQVSLQSLQRVQLRRHTRCYLWLEDEDRWQIGRVDDWDPYQQRYEIALPDRKYCYATEQDLYVRCHVPIEDPTSVLIFKGHETPFFHTHRSAFVRNLTEQRAISHGMPGLFSANITLYPHQVEVVRRVLEDPIQRYLLADEVGLGKTIEAGSILRQFLLDNPTGKALVIVPRSLQEQWRKELADKFYLSEEIQLVAAEDLGRVTLSPPDFLIIDEAHHIAAMAASEDATQQDHFSRCRRLAHGAQGLLLLSATPALNHEQAFLAMLHFLDPQTYSLDDLQGFKERIRLRQDIGRVLLSFKATASPFVLKMSIGKLKALFEGDQRLRNWLDQLKTQLEAGSAEGQEIDGTVRTIRTHISDTYRLHRRMLRNRRDSVRDVLVDQGDATFQMEFDAYDQAQSLHEYLDEWRIRALSSAEPESDEWRRLSQLYKVLFLASGSWHRVLEWAVSARSTNKNLAEINQTLGQEALSILTETPHFDGEEALLEQMLELTQEVSEECDRIHQLQTLVCTLRDGGGFSIPKLVIFTCYTPVCREIVRRLRAKLGNEAVATLQTGQSSEVVEENEQHFKHNSRCFVMACDASGEEGHNLQFADYMVHFDLPWSPNRIEQRHGRMNRIGLMHSMKYLVFSGSEAADDPHAAWVVLLGSGLNLFKESIASLQFYVDSKLPELETVLFQEGEYGCNRLVDILQEEIASEKVSIDEQHALDEIDALDDRAAEYFNALDEYDGRHKEIQQATEGWLCRVLQFKRWYTDPSSQKFFWYKPVSQTQIPVNEILEFLSPQELQRSGNYNRRHANCEPGKALFRVGAGVIDAFADYVQWDDRGRAFALWRHIDTWPANEGMEWLGFRFDYVIEADLSPVKQLLDETQWQNANLRALQRRADALFPPFFRTVYLDTRMQVVKDTTLLEILNRSYSQKGKPRQDYNLAKSRLEVIDEFISRDDWESLCRDARTHSEESLRRSEEFQGYCQRYAEKATRKLDERLEQLTLRLEKQTELGHDRELAREVEVEQLLRNALLNGIVDPRVSLDSIGFYIVAGRPPHIGEDDD
ncbi:helicase [Phormidium sp. FACHB-1136]|nr:helicase [Phormidium sp. FACHB-1136]